MGANLLACLFLLSISGLCSANLNNKNKDGQHPLESVQLTHLQVKSLCSAVAGSHIDNGQLYQWIPVQKQQQQQQPEKTDLKKPVTCFKIGFTPCLGETRFPLTKDCGIFNLFPANDEECSSSSSSRTKRSVSDQTVAVSLSHAQAHHLCHSFGELPKSLDEIDYTAIKIHAFDQINGTVGIGHPSEECVAWTYKPCMLENEADCDVWTKIVKPGKNCAIFHSEDPADHLQRSQLHQEISSSSMPEMRQFISCKSTGSHSGVKCQVVPVGTEISAEEVNEEKHLRQKRGLRACDDPCCCSWWGTCTCCCSRRRHSGYGGRCGFWCVICPEALCGGSG